MTYDILIVGGGPAGLSAAVNGRARGKSVLLLSSPMADNPLWKAERVENYLGLPGVTGPELLGAFRRHAEASGAEIRELRALSAMPVGETWYLSGEEHVFEGRSLVLAAGAVRGKALPGEERLLGRGVSYCATCDGMLYRGRDVVVLGWTESAEREADFLRRAFEGVTPAYHMNKTHWNTVYLDSDVPREEIERMTLASFELTAKKPRKSRKTE